VGPDKGGRTSKAIVAGAAALSLATVLATAGPVAGQQHGGLGPQSGGWGRPGAMAPESRGGSAVPPGAVAPDLQGPFLGDPFWSDCWRVRPIYSISGAWLDNRRVNVCD
jgi:hypothetical protein